MQEVLVWSGQSSFSVLCFFGPQSAWVKMSRDVQHQRLYPLRPNNDLRQTSHCIIKGLSVREVMRIENMITQVKFY